MLLKWIDRVNEGIGKLVSWLTLALVLMICVDVLLRYLFSYSSAAFFELEWHFFAAIFLLGAAYTLKHDRHVRVDVFYHNFSEKTKAWVNLLGTIFFLFPFTLVVAYTSWPFVVDAYQMGESSPDAGGLPYRFVIKSAIPLGFGLLLLQGIAEALRSLQVIGKKTEAAV